MSKDIRKLISESESQFMELKEKFNEGVLKTISAFANTSGETLLIGVSDKKEVVGLDLKDSEFKDIVDKIVDSLGFQPEIKVIKFDSKKLIKIDVPKSAIPIKYRGIYYKRVGNTTREMSTDELSRFFKRDLRWERLTNEKFNEDYLDKDAIENFISLGTARGRLNLPRNDISIIDLLTMLGLIENGRFTNACILLFGKNPQQFFLGARMRVMRLKDEITIIGDRWIGGNLFKQYYETEEAIKSLINVRYEIKGFNREDIWDYPLPAIREAIANALVHRDYLEGRETQIKVYDDKIWFNNLGGLPEGITLEELLSAHASRPRNPLIANIFYTAGIIESLGSGIERMRNALKGQNLPEPEIKANHVEFNLWFMKDRYTEEYLKTLGLNERQIKAVMYVKKNGRITNREYRELVNISDEGARLDLKGLVEKSILVAKGKGRSLHYAINKFGD
ncbi:MAG: ATP-binding protein [Caldisericum sp.]|uniref:ATP-binding protein n=1 Tax=Caldisericum sp. TaxID=2499687 RepID=UPI003D10E5F8